LIYDSPVSVVLADDRAVRVWSSSERNGGRDDGGGGLGPAGDGGTDQSGDSGSTGGSTGDPFQDCTMLETTEVEAQFGELGEVADPFFDVGGCAWEIGDQEGFGTPEGFGDFLDVRWIPSDPDASMEETFGGAGYELVEGLADEAWISPEADTLVLRRGSLHVSLATSLSDEVPDLRDKMVTLAELVLNRV
jgi:hypothetical protein